jgi:4-amino-4-deoxy-L-arabinose transferase-like glycosyltransferase
MRRLPETEIRQREGPPQGKPWFERHLVVLLVAGLAILFAGALALTWTIPFQEWDAYSCGTWAVRISEGSSVAPAEVDSILLQRPVVYVGEGWIWRLMGRVSMRAGRLYSLSFSVLLVFATGLLARRENASTLTAWLAAFLAAASPLVTEQVSSTLSDIPAAALLWAGALALFRAEQGGRSRAWWLLAGMGFALCLLAKVTALPLVAALIVLAAWNGRTRTGAWHDRVAWAFGLGVPLLLVVVYFNVVRRGLPWSQFLYGWAGPYYSQLAAGFRISNLERVQWFGVFLSVLLLFVLGSSLLSRVRARGTDDETGGSGGSTILAAFFAGWVLWGSKGLTTPLREYGSARWDFWFAGFPTIVAALAFFLMALDCIGPLRRFERDYLLVVLAFSALWWWKLGYDRRFLVVVLPPVAVLCARWIVDALANAPFHRRTAMSACAMTVLFSAGWEGSRRMDHAYPVFSRAFLEINRKNGLSPEAKLVDIFGDSARVIQELQRMLRANPRLRIVSPDNRLRFHLGDRFSSEYLTGGEDLTRFDLLVWVNNTGVLEMYRQDYGVVDPLGKLKATGLLTELMRSAEYEVYRIGKP